MSRCTMDSPVSELSGVGKARASQLGKLGIQTVRDLIYHFPRAYEKRSDVRLLSGYDTDAPRSYVLTVASAVKSASIKRGLTISKFRAFDESGSIEIVFFNSPYVKDVFHVGEEFRFYGKITQLKNKLQLSNPKYESTSSHTPLADFMPVYHLTEGLSSKILGKLIKEALNDVIPQLCDPMPEYLRLAQKLTTLPNAIKNLHFPENEALISSAITRLAFDEMFYFALGISLSASRKKSLRGIKFSPCSLSPLLNLLPFELTDSQKHVINDIYADTVIAKNGEISPMGRIIVGDVGSGKTVCAIAAMYICATSGYQSALMVPTEILARQHFKDVCELLGRLGIKCELLLGSTTQKEKKRIYQEISDGTASIVIGTHALISEKVDFANLGLIVTDEQHRFGVAQRSVLKDKSKKAHMLVMSATPIPRTLALALYGDLDVSKITEIPKGRQKIDTYVVDESYRKRMNAFIQSQVNDGGQCYIVCPSIESEEGIEETYVPDGISGISSQKSFNLKNATDYASELKKALPSLRIEVLHGRMTPAQKDEIMNRFSLGEVDVLVSTTVIEVGVNVPNASVMIVENAERFGLSQLHQLRGRVGRGSRKSYCILVSDLKTEKAMSRLEIMRSTANGYEIAEKDLMMRGPGDFFSANSNDNLRQSGGFEFHFATMCDKEDLFVSAFSAAKQIASADGELALEEHALLKAALEEKITVNSSTIS